MGWSGRSWLHDPLYACCNLPIKKEKRERKYWGLMKPKWCNLNWMVQLVRTWFVCCWPKPWISAWKWKPILSASLHSWRHFVLHTSCCQLWWIYCIEPVYTKSNLTFSPLPLASFSIFYHAVPLCLPVMLSQILWWTPAFLLFFLLLLLLSFPSSQPLFLFKLSKYSLFQSRLFFPKLFSCGPSPFDRCRYLYGARV